MKARASSFWEWQKHFSDDEACIKGIIKTVGPKASGVSNAVMTEDGY